MIDKLGISESEYLNYLKMLVPLGDLTQDNLRELAHKTPIQTLAKGKTLFKQGDANTSSFYLVTGQLAVRNEAGKLTVSQGTPKARYPIDHNRPRKATAVALTDVQYIEVDNNYLDLLLTWEQSSGSYSVADVETEDEDNDWMSHLLRSEIFHRIPASNIQAVLMKLEPVHFSKGEEIIHQGDDGDYYYHIRQGRCQVTHTTKSGKCIKLAELEAGTGFGEEALLSNAKRNATVTMLTDGVLMRLGKEDFQTLLSEAVLKQVDFAEAEAMVENGARWLDVRLESEYKNGSIKASTNLPLYLLRFKTTQLDKGKTYIVYCDTGRRSSSAAFILSERGFDVCVLKDGFLGQNIELD